MESSPFIAEVSWVYGVIGAIGLVGLSLLACYVLIGPFERRRLRRLRTEHLRTHPALSDEEFLRQAAVPPEGSQIALAVREAVAGTMGVSESTLHPVDGLGYLDQFSFDPMGYLEFVEDICWSLKRLGLKTSEQFWKPFFLDWRKRKDLNLGDLVRFVVENRNRIPLSPQRS